MISLCDCIPNYEGLARETTMHITGIHIHTGADIAENHRVPSKTSAFISICKTKTEKPLLLNIKHCKLKNSETGRETEKGNKKKENTGRHHTWMT